MGLHSEIKPQVKQSHVFTVCTASLLEWGRDLDNVIRNFLNVGISSPCDS